jgi:hypothetical protein
MISHVRLSHPRLFGFQPHPSKASAQSTAGADVFDASYGITGIIIGAVAGVLAGVLLMATPGVPPEGTLLTITSIVFATGGFVVGSMLGCCW